MAKNLIGLCGYAGSGKSEFAKELCRWTSDYTIKGYSHKLKVITSVLTGAQFIDLENQEFKACKMDEIWTDPLSGHTPTYREFLQKLGTDVMRDHLDKDVWVKAMFADYKPPKLSEYNPSRWIIADVRFPNEAHAIRERGGVLVRLERGRPVNNHVSEVGLDDYYFDYIVDNTGTIEQLREHAKNFYETVIL